MHQDLTHTVLTFVSIRVDEREFLAEQLKRDLRVMQRLVARWFEAMSCHGDG